MGGGAHVGTWACWGGSFGTSLPAGLYGERTRVGEGHVLERNYGIGAMLELVALSVRSLNCWQRDDVARGNRAHVELAHGGPRYDGCQTLRGITEWESSGRRVVGDRPRDEGVGSTRLSWDNSDMWSIL